MGNDSEENRDRQINRRETVGTRTNKDFEARKTGVVEREMGCGKRAWKIREEIKD